MDSDDTTLETLTAAVVNLDDRLSTVEQALQPGIWPQPDPQLTGWVANWLIPTFQIGPLLGDWTTDPACVSDLAALYHAYVGALDPHADTFAPLRWHAELQAMLTRIQTYHQRRAPGGWRPA